MAADVTVVVPWRDIACEYRRRNLAELRAWLKPLGWPIILADSDGANFNRSQARNNGVKQAETPIIVLHDADLRVSLRSLKDAVRLVTANGGMRHPYRICRYLGEDDTQRLLHGETPLGSIRTSTDAPGGCAVIRRADYLAIGGYDESYKGWGFEDLDFAKRANERIGQTWGRDHCWHLWHPEAPRDRLTTANKHRFNAASTPTAPKMTKGDTDVVYRVRPGDNNEELRYSLRSLVNFPHRKVWIVGHKPSWVSTSVSHIKGNPHPTKWPNVYDNLRIACQHPKISDPFVLLDDDMYLMAPMTLATVPNWTRGSLAAQVQGVAGQGLWGESLRNTLDYLTGIGITEPISYERHIPYVVHKAEMLAVLDAARDYSWPVPPQWRTLDGNINKRGGKLGDDVKVRRGITNIPETALLSSDDLTFQRLLGRLRHAFPQQCVYEATPPETVANPALDFYRAALRRRGTPTQRARAV